MKSDVITILLSVIATADVVNVVVSPRMERQLDDGGGKVLRGACVADVDTNCADIIE